MIQIEPDSNGERHATYIVSRAPDVFNEERGSSAIFNKSISAMIDSESVH